MESSSFFLIHVFFWLEGEVDISEPDDSVSEHEKLVSLSTIEVSKGARIRNRYNQVPHLTHDTNGKVTNSQ